MLPKANPHLIGSAPWISSIAFMAWTVHEAKTSDGPLFAGQDILELGSGTTSLALNAPWSKCVRWTIYESDNLYTDRQVWA